MAERIGSYKELRAYQAAFEAAMRIFKIMAQLVRMIEDADKWLIK